MRLTNRQRNILDAISSGNTKDLAALRASASAEGNDLVEVDWELTYEADNSQLLSLYSLEAKDPANIIDCTLSGLLEGDTVLASGLASSIELKASSAESYTGWTWRDYTPSGRVTIEGEIYGQITLKDGTTQSFKFSKTLDIPG